MDAPNLQIFENTEEFMKLLDSFGIVQKGHFEYKGVGEDGNHMHGAYYINYRLLTTAQEKELAPYYLQAINNWFGDVENLIIAGVAMASLFLPKVIQLQLYEERGLEFVYTEKRNGVLGLYGEQAKKCQGKQVLFIEDVCNNGTSTEELMKQLDDIKDDLGISGYSVLYGVHRGHHYFDSPEGIFYAMGHIKALAYESSECPVCEEGEVPLKEYRK